MKRAADQEPTQERRLKRSKVTSKDHLSQLTDELVLRIFSFVEPAHLCTCQRLSHRFNRLATDSSLWRTLYFQRFVQRRASRLPRRQSREGGHPQRLSHARKWLDDQHFVSHGPKTDWKKQYKLKHNWSNGSCDVGELVIDRASQDHPVVVDMHGGVIYTADRSQGLRAWSKTAPRRLLGQTGLATDTSITPTTISIDIRGHVGTTTHICVGFDNGVFHTYNFDLENGFSNISCDCDAQQDTIKALAVAWPLVLTLSSTQRLRIFDLTVCSSGLRKPPRLVYSVQANKHYWPTSVHVRDVGTEVLVSIAYIEPTYFSGYIVGLQEIRLSGDGQLISSRTASTLTAAYRPLTSCSAEMLGHAPVKSMADPIAHSTGPLSLSYTHPYLLVSQPDRTLTLYMVTSTPQALSLSHGRTLWGHASSVSGAHIGKRGKAVSASKRGDELLIWELERELPFGSTQSRSSFKDKGVLAKPAIKDDAVDTHLSPNAASRYLLDSHYDGREASGWLGFDAENAVVLRKDGMGRHVLTIYDFT